MEYTSPNYSKEQEKKEIIEKIERKDVKRSWTSASAFIFYLTLACFILFTWGGCYKLYTKRFEKPKVNVQSSTLYNPQYK